VQSLQNVGHHCGPSGNFQLREGPADVLAHGVFADPKGVRDLLVALSLSYKQRNLHLAPG
jgi:hypothetical protein